MRARCLGHCGWFPTYTITEDYALGMELKTHGYRGTYLLDYLVVGEAPDEVRNVMRQRSRWCKGHMQVRSCGRAARLLADGMVPQRAYTLIASLVSSAAATPGCTARRGFQAYPALPECDPNQWQSHHTTPPHPHPPAPHPHTTPCRCSSQARALL